MSIRVRVDACDVEIIDPIERRTFTLRADGPVTTRSIEEPDFVFPVDQVVSFSANELRVPSLVATYIRSCSGNMISQVEAFTTEVYPSDVYYIEICAPMKLYLRVEGSFKTSADFDGIYFEFDECKIELGMRSHHDLPEATITVTDTPDDVLAGLSYLGSALKTTSCERSFPTLRGHPPLIEVGDRLHVPEELERPETGVKIEIPARLEAAYIVAPLAYYLGAELVPANRRAIATDTGFEHPLDTRLGFEKEVERVLKQVFFFDCLTRTEGYYEVDLHERNQVEPLVDLDFTDLYGSSIPDQLERYLSVPYEVIESFIPEWKLTSYVEPSIDNVETLPFVVDDLAVIKSPRSRRHNSATSEVSALDQFMRAGEFVRSTSGAEPSGQSFVEPMPTDSLEQAWIGDDAPLNASKSTKQAFNNRLARPPSNGDVEIVVVCNDPDMGEEEAVVDGVYGSREDLPFEVAVEHELTTGQLRKMLETSTDFLHYIGHIDGEGFECVDGKLDARTLEHVGVDAFLLNACQSYEQGMALIEAGSIGGIVTLSDVINSGAVTMGCNIARLLNRGFPLRSALNIAKDESIIGGQYIVVGDGNTDITQVEGGTPVLCEIDPLGSGYEVTLLSYTTSSRGMGTMISPQLRGNSNKQYLNSGIIDTIQLSSKELENFIQLENSPVRFDGQFTWTEDIDSDEL